MWSIRVVFVALAVVVIACGAGLAFGVTAGLTPGSTGGAEDRPLVFWLIAPSFLVVCLFFWPLLLSWFVPLRLPRWHMAYVKDNLKPTSIEGRRRGRTIAALARSLEPHDRLRLAGPIVGYGLFYVLISVPVPIFFGVAGTVGNGLQMEEGVPLALAMWIPLLWTLRLLIRGGRAGDP